MKAAIAILSLLILTASSPMDMKTAEEKAAFFKGTWAGKSMCVGDHPACKNENVVYRFVPFSGAPWQMRLLADKIIEGKRVPMGALMFAYDDTTRGMKCEFKRGTTRGVWYFEVDGDSLTGKLLVLPAGDKARDVRAKRVIDDSHLPAAPALKEYEN